MPGFLLHVNAIMQCAHMAPATTTPTQTRVLVNGQPVATVSNLITVQGCLFTIPGPKAQPCVLVKWLMPATRVLVNGQPALLQPSPSGVGSGICQSVEQIPQGPPVISMVQTRVLGT
jgi:hypothetical protein